MKKTMEILLALCLCLGLCACGGASPSNNVYQPTPTQKPEKYEDTLIEKLKIYDSREKAEEVFGKPESVDENGTLTFDYVKIFGEDFRPTVYIDYGSVSSYRYDFDGYSEAKCNVAYKKLVDNFTVIYGEPYESDEDESEWFFENGTKLRVFKGQYFVPQHKVGILFSKG